MALIIKNGLDIYYRLNNVWDGEKRDDQHVCGLKIQKCFKLFKDVKLLSRINSYKRFFDIFFYFKFSFKFISQKKNY